jgi:3-methyladenine DNA glycosylase Mpg
MGFDFSGIKFCLEDHTKFGQVRKVRESAKAALPGCIKAIEALTESLLGATLVVRGEEFYIRMLEIYYGGIGDPAHDWYRSRYVYKTSKYIGQTEVQEKNGFKIYLSGNDVNDPYTRMDLVVGHEGVPASLLLRSVWDKDFKVMGEKRGSPNKILHEMGIRADDHGKEILVDGSQGDFILKDTHLEKYKENNLVTRQHCRYNVTDPFEVENNLRWQFMAEMQAN